MSSEDNPWASMAKPLFLLLFPLSALFMSARASVALSLGSGIGNEYAIIATIPAPGAEGIWDYAIVDAVKGRLYLAQNGVTVLDISRRAVTPNFYREAKPRSAVPIHATIPIGNGDVVAISNSSKNSVVFLRAATGQQIATTQTSSRIRVDSWHDPDYLLYDAAS